METELPEGRCTFDHHFEEHDQQKSYPVGCFGNNMEVPLLIFTIQNDGLILYAGGKGTGLVGLLDAIRS